MKKESISRCFALLLLSMTVVLTLYVGYTGRTAYMSSGTPRPSSSLSAVFKNFHGAWKWGASHSAFDLSSTVITTQATRKKTPAVKKTVFNKLSWAGAPLRRGQPQWQLLDTNHEAFVYSAHVNDIDFPPLIRIIGFARARDLSYKLVTCIFYFDPKNGRLPQNGSPERRVSGTLYLSRKPNGRWYVGSYVDCPLDSNITSLPHAVSVFKPEDREDNNYMIIHNSHSDEWIQRHRTRGNFSDVFNNHPGADGIYTPDEMDRKRGEDTSRWNITRCFPAIQRNFDKHTALAEMVSASIAFGVQHFVFYVEAAGPNVLRMLKVLEDSGLAEVHPWNVHLNSNSGLYYAGQFSAIQECLYRHLWSSRYLLFGDMDELFVPRTELSLLPVIQSAYQKRPKCGSFLFLHTSYNCRQTQQPPRNVDPLGLASKYELRMLTHVFRESKYYGSGSRSKVLLDPHRIRSGSYHVVYSIRTGFKGCNMPREQAWLQHYKCFQPSEKQINDTYVWKVGLKMIQQYQQLLAKHNHTVSQPYP